MKNSGNQKTIPLWLIPLNALIMIDGSDHRFIGWDVYEPNSMKVMRFRRLSDGNLHRFFPSAQDLPILLSGDKYIFWSDLQEILRGGYHCPNS